MTYRVMAVSEEEAKKADQDHNYAPVEHEIDQFDANHEHDALLLLNRRIKSGRYPRSAMIVEA